MQAQAFWVLESTSNDELLGNLQDLLLAGARTEARVVAHLAELDARRLTLLGGVSLFEYCVTRLGLSEHEAYFRIATARTARRFPAIFELLEQRELHLSAVALLSRHLTRDNHLELLEEAKGKTKRELLQMMARRWPKADFTSQVRSLPAESMAAGPTGSLEYLSQFSHRLELLLSTRQHDKLELARDLISHGNPNGDLSVVIERALDLLIAHEQRRQFGITKRRRARQPSSNSVRTELPNTPGLRQGPRDRIPNEIRRQILERDGFRCTYQGPDGRRCECRRFLQIHHEQAWARGGPETLANLRLLCSAHNQLLGEIEFGQDQRAG